MLESCPFLTADEQPISLADDQIFNGMMGAISKDTLPDGLRAVINLANPGELIGSVEVEGLWYLVRVEKFLDASLEEQLKQELEDELFEQWLEEKIENINVKLQVKF
jgi:parvulin-like peptidyl-prolyl isomerase